MQYHLASPFIEKIHLFIDDEEALNTLKLISNNSDKFVIICVGKKPKYIDFFRYIVEHLKNTICMITNTDILLYECDQKLITNVKENKISYALTRYEHDMSHPLIDNYLGSHDCYIFNSAFLESSVLSNENINFFQNFPGIESHIIKTFCDEGFKVQNPCYQIKIVHLHQSGLRQHGKWIGLHDHWDVTFLKQSVWFVPPTIIN
jgi:hypothetical protein